MEDEDRLAKDTRKHENSERLEENLQPYRRKTDKEKIRRWNGEQGWEHVNTEDGENHRTKRTLHDSFCSNTR